MQIKMGNMLFENSSCSHYEFYASEYEGGLNGYYWQYNHPFVAGALPQLNVA
jgi:hypothetical protein